MARNEDLHAQVEPFGPDVLVTGETDLEDFGITARIMPTPGHTAGSVSVLTAGGDLVAGDLIANSFFGPVRGRPADPPFHDDPVLNLASLRKMLALNPTSLHVGHGTPLDPDRVRRWASREHRRPSRRAATGRIRARTAEETTAEGGRP
ncbi:MBL fold metallo-hydrolase [Streptomyces sp. NPDC046371]|uniref:MBL fold metallo-hydrolase n=1 Tax=Streptomyces sp. NPDC046371 TaxID=3154916 RepID=UPI0033E30F23